MDSNSDAKSNIQRDLYQEDDEDPISLASIPLTPSKRQRSHPPSHSHSHISISSSPVDDLESPGSAPPSTLKSTPHSPSSPPSASSTHQDEQHQDQPPEQEDEDQNDHLQDDTTSPPTSQADTTATNDDDPDADPHRPNRWNGPATTWMAWTATDRQAWYALEGVRRGDLSAHLFNALGLRRGLRRANGASEGDEEDGEAGIDVDVDGGWELGKAWTAWPMRAAEVPRDRLMPRAVDVNEPFTFRREEEPAFVGRNLEEEISAGMLRCAGERFRKRGLGGRLQGAEGGVMKSVENNDGGATTGGETDLDVGETTGWDDETDAAPSSSRRRLRSGKRRGGTSGAASPSFTPTLSADDERSYALLRPAARQIMSRLDATLMILHNQRMAGLGNLSESSTGEEDETDGEMPIKPPQKSSSVQTPTPQPQPTKRGRGRPRIERVLLEGETEHQMRLRIARKNRKKKPVLSMASEPESGAETERQQSQTRSIASSPASSRASSRSRGSSVSSETNREKFLTRWGLRNWKDVLSAAALAGFPPKVIARATQRCSTLFRQEMTMHTLHPRTTSAVIPSSNMAGSHMAGVETVRYVPGQPIPSSSEEDGDSDKELKLAQLRAVSRRSSVKPTSGMSSSESDESDPDNTRAGRQHNLLFCPHPSCRRSIEPFDRKSNLERHLQAVHDNRTPDPTEPAYQAVEEGDSAGYKRRRRSATPGLATHLCPHPKCPRAIEGFTKGSNLTRHLRTTHGGYLPDEHEEKDSADEMEGGIHVDRFLQPIKFRKGWRAEDMRQRQRMGRSAKRARMASEELDSFL
ncbi:uncharacterized protein C8A04DRAFT_11230 [Dichotomopilus funicola]|uniref:C2H2-type domain-containing protein n=1 Tax=Dichotomopilus funicola TaxID=1934379 RepID=A0AAN6ZPR8_9PEZI|nr:hypothetical protein C8A04DRAFT_11230 [Dichotomopilus funicola]